MGMSGRLLRPRQSLHAETANWVSRVVANGGTASGSTVAAVDRFVKSIYAAGIRDRFYRLNLFCGTSNATLDAVRTPLFRGPSLTGTQVGGTTDTNVNFVQGDYAETGSSGGLKGNQSTKALNTGVTFGTVPVASAVFSAYAAEMETTGASTARVLLGCYRSNASFTGVALNAFWDFATPQRRLDVNVPGSGLAVSQTGTLPAAAFVSGGHVSGTSYQIFSNGVSVASGTATIGTQTVNTAGEIAVFAVNNPASNAAGNALSNYTNARIRAYAIGISMTAEQQLAFYTAMQAFQTALGRQV